MRPRSFDVLIGHTIKSLAVSECDNYLRFDLDDKVNDLSGNRVFWCTNSDCCNAVYFYHMQGVDALIGAKIISIEENFDRGLDDVGDMYGTYHGVSCDSDARNTENNWYAEKLSWTFITNKGRFVIDVRNDNNGYYGGNIDMCNEETCTKTITSEVRLSSADYYDDFRGRNRYLHQVPVKWIEITDDR